MAWCDVKHPDNRGCKCAGESGHGGRHLCGCGNKWSSVVVPDSRPVNMPSVATHMKHIADREIESRPATIFVNCIGADGNTLFRLDLNETEPGKITCSYAVRDPSIEMNGVTRSHSLTVYLRAQGSAERVNLVSLATKIAAAIDETIKDLQGRD